MEKIKFWDEYEIKARYIPCFIAAVFPVHFCIQFLGKSFWESIVSNIGWLAAANLSLSLIITLTLIQLQCSVAKHWIEEGVFGKGGINFPTTSFLLFQDSFLSKRMKGTIREKIIKDFNFELMNEIQEQKDIDEARRLAREAVGFIRRLVCKGVMTHQYNIRYGFMRNLIGGVLWSVPGSFGCAIWYGYQKNWHASAFFIACGLVFASLFVFKQKILQKFANQYAQILFNEYLMQKGAQK